MTTAEQTSLQDTSDAETTPDRPAILLDQAEVLKSLQATGTAAYHWNVLTDELTWSESAETVVGIAPARAATGKHFASILHPENSTTRYDAIVLANRSPSEKGGNYKIEYRICPEGKQHPIWLEDSGKWIAGRDGMPNEAYGVVRRIDVSTQAGRDDLTGMMNRDRITTTLGEAIRTIEADGGHTAFALAALGNLGLVNEAYGFEIADELIVAIGKRLQQALRAGDVVARYSGSKFAIILNSCSPRDLPMALDRFVAVVRDSVIETSKGPVWAMLAVGGVSVPENANSVQVAIAHAENALSDARNKITEGIVIYTPSQQRQIDQLLNARCASEIVLSLKRDDFKLAFQPVKDAASGKVVMHEALLRMIDESGEIITAGHLIPVAERLGLVRLIDRAVTQMTIAALHSNPDARVSMNVSTITALDHRWNSQLLEIVAANKAVAARLTVEINEQVLVSNLEAARTFIENLRELGCGVAIDDFGAGYKSFRNIRELPVTMIKLDGSFCHNLASNKDNAFFVKSLLDLAHKFNLKVVAEWVESEADAKLLAEWGMDYIQGHYVGEAVVNPSWLTQSNAAFDLVRSPDEAESENGHNHAQAAESTVTKHVAANSEQAEPIPDHLASDENQDVGSTKSEQPELEVIHSEDLGSTSRREQQADMSDFPDFDAIYAADIARLKGTLNLLDEFFAPPPAHSTGTAEQAASAA
jgi:diguanylate cyclase (GGDEF)-like protein